MIAEFVAWIIAFVDNINPWVVLVIAIMFSTFGTTCLKLSDGFRNLFPIIGVLSGYSIFFVLITLLFKRIDISLGYAVWSGLSTTMVSIVGIVFFKEELSIKKALGLMFIIIGVVGLNLLN